VVQNLAEHSDIAMTLLYTYIDKQTKRKLWKFIMIWLKTNVLNKEKINGLESL